MIKTKKEIDIANYSLQDVEMRKIIFTKIRTITDIEKDNFIIHFEERKVTAENVVKQRKVVDENNEVVKDEFGNIVYEDYVDDETKYLRSVSTELTRDVYYQIASQVLEQLPDSFTRKQEDNLIAEMGIKLYISNGGYYKGQLTMQDFE